MDPLVYSHWHILFLPGIKLLLVTVQLERSGNMGRRELCSWSNVGPMLYLSHMRGVSATWPVKPSRNPYSLLLPLYTGLMHVSGMLTIRRETKEQHLVKWTYMIRLWVTQGVKRSCRQWYMHGRKCITLFRPYWVFISAAYLCLVRKVYSNVKNWWNMGLQAGEHCQKYEPEGRHINQGKAKDYVQSNRLIFEQSWINQKSVCLQA